jgi:hypothetical protein
VTGGQPVQQLFTISFMIRRAAGCSLPTSRYWPWSLMDYLPSAARAAGGRPSLVIWHFQLPAV